MGSASVVVAFFVYQYREANHRFVVAVGVVLCVSSSAFAQSVRVSSHGPGAHSLSVHVSTAPNSTVKRVVKKTWIAGEFVWRGRTVRWVPGHYEYRTVIMSCGAGHWTRQYGRDVWVAGRCSAI